jgi:hyperosmotically inducible protein
MKNGHLAPVILLVVALICSACAKPDGGTSIGGAMDDATVTTRVKTAFINDPVVGAARIDVETFKGVVTLSGRVKSKDEETKAIALARTVKGVAEVKSTLLIQP